MKGSRILITGGIGFIGSNLARRCVASGAEVTLYDCLDPRSGGNLHNLEGIEEAVEVIHDDIRNFNGLSRAVQKKDIVFNCAAYTSHPDSMRDPLVDIEVNCKGVINLLEAVRRFNRQAKIVHVGTSTQVGKMRHSAVDEQHPEFPVDIYSANKTASEKYVLIYGGAYQMHATVVRLGNVYGPRSNIKSPDFGFMNFFIGLALQGKEIPVFGDGAQLRNVTYVDDCVAALILAAEEDASDREVFFATSDAHHTVLEIAEEIARTFGGSMRRVEWPKERQIIEIGDARISNRKIKSLLGWSPQYDLRSGLESTRDFFASRRQQYLQ